MKKSPIASMPVRKSIRPVLIPYETSQDIPVSFVRGHLDELYLGGMEGLPKDPPQVPTQTRVDLIARSFLSSGHRGSTVAMYHHCLLYTSDAADDTPC
eukprot:3259624-Amphidinium_carterae.1